MQSTVPDVPHPRSVFTSKGQVFDVGVHDRLPALQLILLGLQNVFGMTGMFVFPALLGLAFKLAPFDIAYVYGMTFIASGVRPTSRFSCSTATPTITRS